jgi:AcrR family transcriptional regulator
MQAVWAIHIVCCREAVWRSSRGGPSTSRTPRAALLDAAGELFAEDGYAGTGTADIVARAGLTRGALYHHFRDKAACSAP